MFISIIFFTNWWYLIITISFFYLARILFLIRIPITNYFIEEINTWDEKMNPYKIKIYLSFFFSFLIPMQLHKTIIKYNINDIFNPLFGITSFLFSIIIILEYKIRSKTKKFIENKDLSSNSYSNKEKVQDTNEKEITNEIKQDINKVGINNEIKQVINKEEITNEIKQDINKVGINNEIKQVINKEEITNEIKQKNNKEEIANEINENLNNNVRDNNKIFNNNKNKSRSIIPKSINLVEIMKRHEELKNEYGVYCNLEQFINLFQGGIVKEKILLLEIDNSPLIENKKNYLKILNFIVYNNLIYINKNNEILSWIEENFDMTHIKDGKISTSVLSKFRTNSKNN